VAAVVFGALSGAFFGLLAVLVRRGLQRGADPRVGSLVIPGVAALTLVVPAVVSGAIDGVPLRDLWPFVLAGALVPGVTQILFTLSVRDAGPSRAAILIGTAPRISVAIAIAVLGEPADPLLLVGTLLVVGGGAVLARERVRPEHFRAIGVAFALSCAALFAVRDNVVRWASRDAHPPPLVTAAVAMLAATAFLVGYLAATRAPIRGRLRPAAAAFWPAGVALGAAYGCIFVAFDRGRVSIVAPLNATQSLWAVALSALILGRAADVIGRRLLVAGVLIVAGAAFIGAVR
jgi:drug/metabolite transporter (DMT)-like permease